MKENSNENCRIADQSPIFTDGDWISGSINDTKNNGNIVQQVITVPNSPGNTDDFVATQKYYYDSLNRIDDSTEDVAVHGGSASQSWRQDFSYDRYGNRNFVETNTTTIPRACGTSPSFTICTGDQKKFNPSINYSNKNQLDSSQGYAYDSSGNMTTDTDSRTFIYDGENKQVQVKDSGNNVIGDYFYDGDGKRIKKYVPDTGETAVFVYDAAGKQIAEYSSIVANSTDAKVAYLTNDHLGSPRINTDASGAVTARHDYHPFGDEVSAFARDNHAEYASDLVRKQFTGYERDGETNLDFAEARYYRFDNGRYTSPDPLKASATQSRPQSWNRYSYCLNVPFRFKDSTGLAPEWVKKDGEVFYDSRVKSQETASQLYGEDAVYRPNGYKYTASDKSSIELLDGGQFMDNGVLENNGDRANSAKQDQFPSVPGSVVPEMFNEFSRTDGDRHETLQVGVGPVSVSDTNNTVNGVSIGEYPGVGVNLSYPYAGGSYTNYRGHVSAGVFFNAQACVGECLSFQSNLLHPISQTSLEPGMGTPQAGIGLSYVWTVPKEAFRRDSFDPITQQQLNRYHPGYPR